MWPWLINLIGQHFYPLNTLPQPPAGKLSRDQWRRWYAANRKLQKQRYWWRGSQPRLRREDVP